MSAELFVATDFHPNVRVYSQDGVHVGALYWLVVDRETWDLQEIIVKETRQFAGHLFAPGIALITDDVVIPLSAVSSVRHDRVDLSMSAAEIRKLPPYLSYQFVLVTPKDGVRMGMSILSGAVYISNLVETAVKTEDQLEIDLGEKIMLDHIGRVFGRVRDVLFDGRELVGVVMDLEGLFDGDVILQVRFLERSDDLVFFARLTEQDLERLQFFHPAD